MVAKWGFLEKKLKFKKIRVGDNNNKMKPRSTNINNIHNNSCSIMFVLHLSTLLAGSQFYIPLVLRNREN